MKKLYIILLILLLTGCAPIQAEPEPIIETVIETVVVTEYIEVENTDRIEQLESEVKQYRDLIANLDEYLSYVYPMKVSNADYSSEGTGFTIEYRDSFYMITAGHGAHYTEGDFDILYTNFKFKSNSGWIYLELLDYNNDYMARNDYAIFISSKIDKGFKVDLDDDSPLFRIGDGISDYRKTTIEGESGSPVIDIDGEVTEIATTDRYNYNTDIDIVLEAIDKLN